MIEEYIKNIMQYQWQCDLRLVHVLYQHKVLWLERVKYLQDEMLLSSDIGAEAFKSVEKLVCQAGTLRSLAIKYEVTNSIKILGKMVQLLPQIKMLDKTLCDKMLAAL